MPLLGVSFNVHNLFPVYTIDYSFPEQVCYSKMYSRVTLPYRAMTVALDWSPSSSPT